MARPGSTPGRRYSSSVSSSWHKSPSSSLSSLSLPSMERLDLTSPPASTNPLMESSINETCATSDMKEQSKQILEKEIIMSPTSHGDDDDDDSIPSSPLSTNSSALKEICFTNDSGTEDFDLNDDLTDDEDETNEDDDSSCASTVVNDVPPRVVRPPPNATPAQQAKFYWELCYGKNTPQPSYEVANQTSWSARRTAPVRSCLSLKKTPWGEIAASASKRLRERKVRMEVTPVQGDDHPNCNGRTMPLNFDLTPLQEKESEEMVPNDFIATPQMETPRTTFMRKSVQFGLPSAVEFESTRPTVELTPLPSEQARLRFPVEEKVDSDDESEELHQETARNGAILAEWDDDFDSMLNVGSAEDDGDDSDIDLLEIGQDSGKMERQLTGSQRHKRSSGRGKRADRRSSTFFAKGGKSLLIDEDDFEKSIPQSPQRGINELNNKSTPRTDMSSSSSLLRSVHSEGGAQDWRARHDDVTQELKPNQLDLRLQKVEGFQSSKEVCVRHSFIPIIFITGRINCISILFFSFRMRH